MVPEKISYQTRYCAKIFPSSSSPTQYIHFYLHLKQFSENALQIVTTLKSASFSELESAFKTTCFMLFLKNLNNTLQKKLVIMFLLIKQINFTHIFIPCMLHLLLSGKTPQPCMAGEKLLMKPRLYVFPGIICIC